VSNTPHLTRVLIGAQVRQPYYLLTPARGVKRWYRGGSRVLHHEALRNALWHFNMPVTAGTGVLGGCGGVARGATTLAALPAAAATAVLDRGFFFPNRYKLAPAVKQTNVRTLGPSVGAGVARGRAGYLSRRLAGQAGVLRGLARLGVGAGLRGGARSRKRPLRGVVSRRRYLGALLRQQRQLRRRKFRAGHRFS
jgi:hypothetical protein